MISFDIKIWWKWVIFCKIRFYWTYFSLQIEKVIWEVKDFEREVTIFAAYRELNTKISLSPIDDHYNEPQKSAMLVRSRRRELMGVLHPSTISREFEICGLLVAYVYGRYWYFCVSFSKYHKNWNFSFLIFYLSYHFFTIKWKFCSEITYFYKK